MIQLEIWINDAGNDEIMIISVEMTLLNTQIKKHLWNKFKQINVMNLQII